jgi:hypothetical protein
MYDYDIGAFITFLQTYIPVTFYLPTKAIRPEYPSATIVPITSNQDDIYQRGEDINDDGDKEITFPRYSLFSITFLGKPDTGSAGLYAQQCFNLLKKQATDDFFSGRNEGIRLLSSPEPRFFVEDNFNEERVGFDIEICDVVTLVDSVESIEQVVVKSTDDKMDDIVVDKES